MARRSAYRSDPAIRGPSHGMGNALGGARAWLRRGWRRAGVGVVAIPRRRRGASRCGRTNRRTAGSGRAGSRRYPAAPDAGRIPEPCVCGDPRRPGTDPPGRLRTLGPDPSPGQSDHPVGWWAAGVTRRGAAGRPTRARGGRRHGNAARRDEPGAGTAGPGTATTRSSQRDDPTHTATAARPEPDHATPEATRARRRHGTRRSATTSATTPNTTTTRPTTKHHAPAATAAKPEPDTNRQHAATIRPAARAARPEHDHDTPHREAARALPRGPPGPSHNSYPSFGYRRTGAAPDRRGGPGSSPVSRARDPWETPTPSDWCRAVGSRSGRPARCPVRLTRSRSPGSYRGAWPSTGPARPGEPADANAGWPASSTTSAANSGPR